MNTLTCNSSYTVSDRVEITKFVYLILKELCYAIEKCYLLIKSIRIVFHEIISNLNDI